MIGMHRGQRNEVCNCSCYYYVDKKRHDGVTGIFASIEGVRMLADALVILGKRSISLVGGG